ncbi:MAG: hypothetical protein R3321_00485 [Nitrososphaeraceae archaeon]|nr:hypothetical protein [Nitrososphaeraceae archaeon]
MSNPVKVFSNGFNIDTKIMEKGKMYSFEYKIEKYHVKKVDDKGTIELYLEQ